MCVWWGGERADAKVLADWLWDINPRPLTDADRVDDNPNAQKAQRGFTGALYKTDAFLATQPFGTVPAGFSPDGETLASGSYSADDDTVFLSMGC